MKVKRLLKWNDTTLFSSAHNRSILWLWTLRPVMTLRLFNPLLCSIYRATPVFSMPWSQRSLKGRPKLCTPVQNSSNTLDALLFLRHCKYMMVRLKPSTHPWKIILHLTSLWFPSICLWGEEIKTITKRIATMVNNVLQNQNVFFTFLTYLKLKSQFFQIPQKWFSQLMV